MKKIWVAAIIFIIVLSASLSFFLTRQKVNADFASNTYCGVEFHDPVYEFRDSSGNVLLALDNKGNLFIGSNYVNTSFSQIIEPKTGIAFKYLASFKMAFSSDFANISGNILENQPDLGLYPPQRNEMLFKDPITNVTLAVFDGLEGSLYIKGKAIYMGAQAGCTEQDRYILSSGSYYWKEIYCDKSISQEDACPSRNKDLDNNASKCEDNSIKPNFWAIGGETAASVCCQDDPNEFKKTFNCSENSRCPIEDSDLCCDNINDCVYGNSCNPEINSKCVSWDSTIVAKCSNSMWSLVTDCRKKCQANSCGTYSTCSSGNCIDEIKCLGGESCLNGNGCSSGICNTEWKCSLSGTYNAPGPDYCQATCDGNGGCTQAVNCVLRSQPCCIDNDGDGWGSPEGTIPACPQTDSEDCDDTNPNVNIGATETCATPYDDDCDESANDLNSIGCTVYYYDNDEDAFGLTSNSRCICTPEGKYTALQGGDCNDNDAAIKPGVAEVCDNIDNDCNNVIDGMTDSSQCEQRGCCAGAYKTCTAGIWGACNILPTQTCKTSKCQPQNSYDQNCNGVEDKCSSGQTVNCADCESNPDCDESNIQLTSCSCGATCSVESCTRTSRSCSESQSNCCSTSQSWMATCKKETSSITGSCY